MLCSAIDGSDPRGSSPDQSARVAALDGFEVRGRIGSLGFITAADDDAVVPGVAAELVVIGGRSSLLHFHIPLEHITSVSKKTRSVSVDVDVVDFTPRVGDDGTVELHITG